MQLEPLSAATITPNDDCDEVRDGCGASESVAQVRGGSQQANTTIDSSLALMTETESLVMLAGLGIELSACGRCSKLPNG